jgi:hypothetical protein
VLIALHYFVKVMLAVVAFLLLAADNDGCSTTVFKPLTASMVDLWSVPVTMRILRSLSLLLMHMLLRCL